MGNKTREFQLPSMDAFVADFFVSHSSQDKELAESLGELLLERRNLTCWIDVWSIPTASEWQQEIEHALARCRGCLILLTENGWGPYHLEEARRALERAAKDESFVVVPLIHGSPRQDDFDQLGDFFHRVQQVALDGDPLEEAVDRIAGGLTGETPLPLGRDRLTPIIVRRDARRWKKKVRQEIADRSSLYRGRTLEEAQLLARQLPGQMDPVAFEFLAESERRQSMGRLRMAFGASVIAVALAVLVIASWWLQNRLRQATSQARANGIANLSKVVRAEDPTRALRIAEVAYGLDDRSVPARQALAESFHGEVHYRKVELREEVRALAITEDGGRIAVGGYGSEVRVFDPHGELLASFGDDFRHVTSLKWASKGETLAVASYHQGARLYEMETGSFAQLGPADTVFATDFLPDGSILVGYLSGALRSYDTEGKAATTFPTRWGNVQSVAVDTERGWVTAGFYGGEVGIWTLTGEPISEMVPYLPQMTPLRLGAARQVALLPGQEAVVSAHNDGSVVVSSFEGRIVHRWPAHPSTIWDMAVDQPGDQLATAGFDGVVRVWRVAAGRGLWARNTAAGPLHELRGNRNWATAVAFLSPHEMVIGGFDGSLRSYELQATQPEVVAQEVYSAVLHIGDDGRFLANRAGGGAALYPSGSGEPVLLESKDPASYPGPVQDFAVSPLDERFAAVFYDGSVGLWSHQGKLEKMLDLPNQPTGKQLCFLTLERLVVGTRGGELWSVSLDGTVSQLADVDSEVNALACNEEGFFVTAGPYNPGPDDTQKLVRFDTRGNEERRWASQGEQVTELVYSSRDTLFLARNGLQIDPESSLPRVINRSGSDVVEISRAGEILREYPGHPERVRTLSIHEREGYLLVGYGISNTSGNDGIRLWDLDSGEVILDTSTANPILAVSLAPDGESFVAAEQNLLTRWLTPKGIQKSLQSLRVDSLSEQEITTLRNTGNLRIAADGS